MKYLLDTCVISELVKAKSHKKVVGWIKKQNEHNLFLSTLTFGELHKGITKLGRSTRKTELHQWVEYDLKERFDGRILPIDLHVAKVWGEMLGRAEAAGNPLPAIDSLIAATGVAYDLIVATRNISDMEASGAALFNPWEE